MKSMNELGVTIPASKTLVTRKLLQTTQEQRERALKQTEYLTFSFPAGMLMLDFLSDSGTTAMSDTQWAALMQGDESYARNNGYYALLDSVRDTFERGDNPKRVVNLLLSGASDPDELMDKVYLTSEEGGFVNGGVNQLKRPNAFIVPQGRAAEFLLFSVLADVLKEIDPNKQYTIPNNGHFDTTEANIACVGIEPVNFFQNRTFEAFPADEQHLRNPFKGDMDIERLIAFIEEKGRDSIPMIYITITNNTIAGQPVSLANIKAVRDVADKYDLPVFIDSARFAENAHFIRKFEEGYSDWSINRIVQEMYKQADGFTISFKKDGMVNMGGGLFLKDGGPFQKRFSINGDIGVRLKERQILTFGNDSYGGMSGRDIMALALGLQLVTDESYLESRITQAQYFARGLAENGLPVVLPASGHAVYLDMDKFMEGIDVKFDDFAGLGFCIELIRRYGIRGSEMGPFCWEWDKKTEEQRAGTLNLVRFAIPRNAYSNEHFDYAIAAVTELYKQKHELPKVNITRGADLRMRHFQSGVEPVYPK